MSNPCRTIILILNIIQNDPFFQSTLTASIGQMMCWNIIRVLRFIPSTKAGKMLFHVPITASEAGYFMPGLSFSSGMTTLYSEVRTAEREYKSRARRKNRPNWMSNPPMIQHECRSGKCAEWSNDNQVKIKPMTSIKMM